MKFSYSHASRKKGLCFVLAKPHEQLRVYGASVVNHCYVRWLKISPTLLYLVTVKCYPGFSKNQILRLHDHLFWMLMAEWLSSDSLERHLLNPELFQEHWTSAAQLYVPQITLATLVLQRLHKKNFLVDILSLPICSIYAAERLSGTCRYWVYWRNDKLLAKMIN